ncbi:MAG: putative glutaconate CoA-transferase [Acidimicrobiales bacterium]|jgi:acyl CoA:acetate/3-ketoacid CoA transferase alpha subunit/acyl CoA:acetate/3-ketoacid CoA transferase beta subunit|nr:putative glutaconate CoA-transferase [Acidimicrobiales bacterium]
MTKQMELSEAVRANVRPGDSVHLVVGHSRWSAASYELVRQTWGTDPEFTLVMLSLSSLGALFFRGGLVRRVITAYSGDSFPTYTPNPIYQEAYQSGRVEVEHWSILTFQQRLEAAARGLPAMVTGSLAGSSMAANADFHEVDTPAGRVGLVTALQPDVAIMHGVVADRDGNVAVNAPLLEGVWGALAAKRGVVATVERIVDDLTHVADRVVIPSHRVLAVVEAPFGAHPGGLFARGLPASGYGEDIDFWVSARDAGRRDFDEWAREWVLDVGGHEAYLAKLGQPRLHRLQARTDPHSWREDEEAHPVDAGAPITAWETAAVVGVRLLRERIAAVGADAVLAGAGVANLSAWVGVMAARADRHPVVLTAELGMWDYTPTPADPYIFNHRSFPTAGGLSDASRVLGLMIGGHGTRVIGCLGAAQVDRFGNINSTDIPGRSFLVGSGGANDVASRATECLVVTQARPHRMPADVGYVTAPGTRVQTVVTDLGVFRKRDGELWLTAVPAGDGPVDQRVKAVAAAVGWELKVDRHIEQLAPVTLPEVLALRRYDPERLFLGD